MATDRFPTTGVSPEYTYQPPMTATEIDARLKNFTFVHEKHYFPPTPLLEEMIDQMLGNLIQRAMDVGCLDQPDEPADPNSKAIAKVFNCKHGGPGPGLLTDPWK